jgi:hypothetical protein
VILKTETVVLCTKSDYGPELLVERIDRLREPLTAPPAVPRLPQGPPDRMVLGVTGDG